MKTYLIQVTIGPVQDFIASARKLRDLWFGSDLLSEFSKTIARSLNEHQATLIFPAITQKSELDKNSDLIVANKILAQIKSDAEPAAIIAQVKADLKMHQYETIQTALAKMKSISGFKFNEERFNQQVEDFGEFFAAWVEVQDGEEYIGAKNSLEGLLASRKNLREFNAPNWKGAGIPKSSLDGMREAITGDEQKEIKGLLKKNERLDAIACIKRFGALGKESKRHQFSDLSGIALSSYRKATEMSDNSQLVLNYMKKFDPLVNSVNNLNNWQDLSENFYLENKDLGTFRALDCYKNMKHEFGEPQKYACILLGDGDNMGKMLDHIKDTNGHQIFSSKLSEFAKNIEATIKDNSGSLIYAGGDDVMAYVPVFSALKCADEVRVAFAKVMDDIFNTLKLSGNKPTFSIGLAIVHHSEPLDQSLNLVRKAEQLAKIKGGRNALAVIQHKRNGSDIVVTGKWDEGSKPGLASRLETMADLHKANILPATLGYQLRQARIEADDELDYSLDGERIIANNAASALVLRIFQQKDKKNELMEKFSQILIEQKSIKRLSDEMVIAKHFADDQKIIDKAGEKTQGETS